MKNFVKKMIEQHANVVMMINNYGKFMNNAINDDKTDKVTAINVGLIVRDLKNLAKDFETCINNENVHFTSDGRYFEEVTNVNEIVTNENSKENKQ